MVEMACQSKGRPIPNMDFESEGRSEKFDNDNRVIFHFQVHLIMTLGGVDS